MAANENLHKAKDAKNDEFYTQLSDVSRELVHYKDHFRDRIILCNCDDPSWSAFWRYFHLNFSHLGLKKLISTHYDKEKPTYKMEYTGGDDGNIEAGVITPLLGNGDFRNEECVELLKEADIVVTNPPFSIAREFYIPQLMEYRKKFLIVGDLNWVTYKSVFPLFQKEQMWFGYYHIKEFTTPDGSVRKFGNKLWFTNLDHSKRHEKLVLWKEYTPEEYPVYDNYDAINVDKVTEIPKDYDGVMGVPITFLDRCCPDQFEILGITLGNTSDYPMTKLYQNAVQHNRDGSTQGGSKVNTRAAVLKKTVPENTVYYTADNADGCLVAVYPRILIRKKG